MIRSCLIALAFLVVVWYAFAAQPPAPEKLDPVQVVIGPGTNVTVIVPKLSREDLIDVISQFFARGSGNEGEFKAALKDSPDLTLILTTRPTPKK